MSPFLPTGTVYGVLLNFRAEFDQLAPQMADAPYRAPPQAPVLYIKPANTFTPHEGAIALPAGVQEVEIGASIALVMGDGGRVAGHVLVNDLSLPHDSFYRPPVRAKCMDGFLGVGPALREGGDAAQFRLTVRVNGRQVHAADFSQLRRPQQQLLAELAEFMTLAPGELLLLGCEAGRPRARAGDTIEIEAPGFATLRNTLATEAAR